MLHEMECVTFVSNDQEYSGVVLGCETEYFWLLVHDLKSVYVGHPDLVFDKNGKKCFETYDRCRAVDELINASAGLSQPLLEDSSNPERIMRLLNVFRMVGLA